MGSASVETSLDGKNKSSQSHVPQVLAGMEGEVSGARPDVIRISPELAARELAFTEEVVENNFSNYSACTCAAFCNKTWLICVTKKAKTLLNTNAGPLLGPKLVFCEVWLLLAHTSTRCYAAEQFFDSSLLRTSKIVKHGTFTHQSC